MIIYLELLLPTASSDPPENATGSCIVFYSVLLRMGFTCAPFVTKRAVVPYTTLPTLPRKETFHSDIIRYLMAVHFCCTGLGVTSTGRYPASCPVKPGLSSPVPFRSDSRDHLSYSYLSIFLYFVTTLTVLIKLT